MQESTRWKAEGNWDQFKGRVKEQWGQITDNDLKQAEGNFDQLVGIIKERTGESLETVHERLDDIVKQYRVPDRR